LPGAIAANLLDRELSGVLRLGRVLFWTVNSLSVDTAHRLGDLWKAKSLEEAEDLWVHRDRYKWLWYLPLFDIPEEVMPGMSKHWRRWLADHASDHFGFLEKHQEVDIPVLNITGWYDQQIGTIKHFTGMVENGRTEHARRNQRLIVGPWTHAFDKLDRHVGNIDFGGEAYRNFYQLADTWFGYWLKGVRTEAVDWPPVQLFVMGANSWRAENEWPLARTVYKDYFLHSGGRANTVAGDGSLTQTPPEQESSDAYTYDPRDPVMTLYSAAGQQAPIDQRTLDGRQDVLVYATPPLESAVEVTGPIVVILWASSSARDTDFIAKLIDVWPDGFAQELCHGIVRARYRESYDRPSLIEPERVYEYTIRLNPTSNLFRSGHRIRLDISSSDFPNFDRNHNTGGDDYRETTLQTARQKIFHDAARPSRVVLPVIP
jgi:putative CocE/NonD family hydrolase